MITLHIRDFMCLLMICGLMKGVCQVPADSLKGTYAGKFYYASPPTSPWIITNDTTFVTFIDSSTCIVQANDVIHYSYWNSFYSDYFSCNSSPPANYYMKFYGSDSVRMIDDNIPQPFPNPAYSMRFYGKRISSNVPIGILSHIQENKVKISPNPASDFITINSMCELGGLKITNCLGQVVFQMKSNQRTEHIDLSQMTHGIYFIRSATGTIKFIKE